MKRLGMCVLALALGTAAPAAPVWEGGVAASLQRLQDLPLLTGDVALPVVESTGVRLAGLAVSLPVFSSESLGTLAGFRGELLRALDARLIDRVLEKVELPTAPRAAAAPAKSFFTFRDRELPWTTLIAFAGGALMLVALGVFSTALLKMSLADNRKHRRMRRRYAP